MASYVQMLRDIKDLFPGLTEHNRIALGQTSGWM